MSEIKYIKQKQTLELLANTLKKIENSIYIQVADLLITAWKSKEPLTYEKRFEGEKVSLRNGDKWGDLFDCAWMNFTGTIPEQAQNQKVVLIIDINGEACVVDQDGKPMLCLTTFASTYDYKLGMPGKRFVPVSSNANAGEKINIWVDAGNNDLFGKLQNTGTIQEACIAICNEPMRQLFYDYEVLHELLAQIDEKSVRHERIFQALYKVSVVLNEFNEAEATEARNILAPDLSMQNGDYPLRISAIGHAHIDLAWLWPIRETIRKGARTFSNVLKLMEIYPDFKFGASQPQLYLWMKNHYPELYGRINQKVVEGRWEIFGAMWVEPDVNISGGEALVRQLIYGIQFFRDEFQQDVNYLFLPDTFGYNGALPQILKKSGIDYFLTIKLSWDEFNEFPYHSFNWQGIDGSEVLVHMPPEGNYNSSAAPRALRNIEVNYKEKGISENALLLYGIGDGGGGPGEEHLERLNREQNLCGLAPVKHGFISEFFNQLEKDKDKFNTWKGELYLGKHQGTLTTHAEVKKLNRKMEIKLRLVEMLCSMAMVYTDYKYPSETLEKIWKEVLLYQFHDILPGTSITRVYDELKTRYAVLFQEVEEIHKDTLRALFGKTKEEIIIFNPLSWNRKEWVCVHQNWYFVEAPALGYCHIDKSKVQKEFASHSGDKKYLENEYYRLEFSEKGDLLAIFDKENSRQVLAENAVANQLTVYHDTGDAWDFDMNVRNNLVGHFQLISVEVINSGPQIILKQYREFGNSKMTQEIKLTASSRRIDFRTTVTWNETHKMLRTAFPVNIKADQSVADIQFGHIKRSTNNNTTWEQAQYEVAGHKWVSLSNRDYGVALLNDCKYGFQMKDNLIDINLLRSTTYPDSVADSGEHEFTYSLFPHTGDHIDGNVVQAGYELNMPLEVYPSDKNIDLFLPGQSFVSLDNKNIIIEAVKKSETGNQIVFRLYDSSGSGGECSVKFEFSLKSVALTNLLEVNPQSLTVTDNAVKLNFKPFEIHTILVEKDTL